MEFLTSFLDLYEKLIEILPNREFLVITIMLLMGFISAYFKWVKNLHTRYRTPIIVSAMILILSIILIFLPFILALPCLRTIIGILTLGMIAGILYSCKHPLLPALIRLRKCREVVEQLKIFEPENIKLFKKRPWYVVTPMERFLFSQLGYQFFFYKEDYKNAYQCLLEIREDKLFDDERKKLYFSQMNCLVQLGALRKAEVIYSKIKDTERDTECYRYSGKASRSVVLPPGSAPLMCRGQTPTQWGLILTIQIKDNGFYGSQ